MDINFLYSTYIPLLISAREALKEENYYVAEKKIILAIHTCFDRPEAYNLLGIFYEKQDHGHLARKFYRISYYYDQTYLPATRNLERIIEKNKDEIYFGI